MRDFAEMQDRLLARLAERLETLEEMSPEELQKFAQDIAISESLEEDLT